MAWFCLTQAASERATLAVSRLYRQNCCRLTPGMEENVVPTDAVSTKPLICSRLRTASASETPPQPTACGWHPAIGTPHHARSQGRVVADQLAYLAQIRIGVAQLCVQKHQHFGNTRQGILASQQCVQLHR